jgi:hypothetical protein
MGFHAVLQAARVGLMLIELKAQGQSKGNPA